MRSLNTEGPLYGPRAAFKFAVILARNLRVPLITGAARVLQAQCADDVYDQVSFHLLHQADKCLQLDPSYLCIRALLQATLPWQNRAVIGAAEWQWRAPRVAHARHRKVCTLAPMALATLRPDGVDKRVTVRCSHFERISKYSSSAGSADSCRPRSRALPASLP